MWVYLVNKAEIDGQNYGYQKDKCLKETGSDLLKKIKQKQAKGKEKKKTANIFFFLFLFDVRANWQGYENYLYNSISPSRIILQY